MRVVAIRYTNRIDRMTAFYESLGLVVDTASRTGKWVELASTSGTVALHEASTAPAPDDGVQKDAAAETELTLEAEEPLEAVKARLERAGFPGAVIIDENYGRSLRIDDPDGVELWINESDRELFT